MTYIEKAIELAVKEGWRARFTVNGIKMSSGNWRPLVTVSGEFVTVYFLDPLFWQALGKALGWNQEVGVAYNGWIIDSEGNSDQKLDEAIIVPRSRYEQYRLTDHLASGKDAESFFEDLLALHKK